MHISSETIDQIVRNVMRDMQSRTTSSGPAAPVQLQTTEDLTSAVRIESKLITEDVLVAARAAGRIISVNPTAVMTPSARDFIRKNAVRLASQVHGSVTAVSGLLIGIGGNSTAISAAAAAGWKAQTAATEIDASTIAAQHVISGIVTCCGGEPSVVACLLNRNSAMRAAVITRTTNLVTLATVMNPQVVCLESSGWSFGELLRLFRTLAPSAPVPATWKELSAGGMR